MSEKSGKLRTEDCVTPDRDLATPTKRRYESPRCEKKRSIHRVTLISGMGVTSTGALSMTN